jgi:hypothetical protein
VSGEEERLALAVWDAIADMLNRVIHNLPEPERDELERTANSLKADAVTLLRSPGSKSELYPFARDMAFAVLDWWNDSSGENFEKLRRAGKAYEQARLGR